MSDVVQLAEGHWCYVAFSTSFDGRRLSAAATREIDYVPPQSVATSSFTAQRTGPNTVHLSWTWPAGSGFALVARSITGCAAIDTVAELRAASPPASFFDATVDPPLADDVDVPPGPVCYAIETDDTFRLLEPIVTATVS